MKNMIAGFIILWLFFTVSMTAVAAETIKIAAIFAKTGDAESSSSIYSLRGLNMAVEEINQQGGISGKHIEVIELDNQSTSIGSKIAASNAVKQNVCAVIGSAWSSHSLAMAPVLQKAGIPMISPISTNPKVTMEGDYIFRVCFTDPFQGKVMAQFARRDIKAETAAVLINTSSDFSMGLCEYFKGSFTQSGGKIVFEGKYLENATDFSDILNNVKKLKPDAVFLPGYLRDSSLVIKQAVKMGIKTVFMGGDGWGEPMIELAGDAVEGHFFSSHWHPDAPFPLSRQLMANYHRKYGEGEKLTRGLLLSYDAVMILADAIRRAGSLERNKIRDALALTKDFQSATGTITFDQNRDPLNKDAVILKFEKGKIVFVKTVKVEN